MCMSPRAKITTCDKKQREFKSYTTLETAWNLSTNCPDELIVKEEDIDTFLRLLGIGFTVNSTVY